ncbi:MAG: ankyrin repeat domain-containing protein [Rubrivivax sp.]|nr:MAG: ankyrin repeat domain-containing protein [Rubrivivax sp.]
MKTDSKVVKKIQDKYHYLVNYGSSDPNEPIDPLTYVDSGGDSLLHIAAQLGDLETISSLIDAGMAINKAGDMGSTALHYAYDGKHQEVVDFLLTKGASTELKNDFGKLPGE